MITALIGGQYGSEGKGLVAGVLAHDYHIHVRVGAANAGHTVYDGRGEKHVMQQIPCAAYANPDAILCIGPGALISPEIFKRELETWRSWMQVYGYGQGYIHIDPRAHVIRDTHVQREAQTDLAERIGSTSTIAREGIGQAQADRVMRATECLKVQDHPLASWPGVILTDVPEYLYRYDKEGLSILLEGTQGTGLSLITGQFPFVTSRNSTAAGLMADAGVAPGSVAKVIMVVRSYPIRVAGNSGPFYGDSREINWGSLGIDENTELTTVTKKVRRVATFSLQQLRDAVVLNGPTEIALTFADYLAPELANLTATVGDEVLPPAVVELRRRIELVAGVPVTIIGTGPNSVMWVKPDLRPV